MLLKNLWKLCETYIFKLYIDVNWRDNKTNVPALKIIQITLQIVFVPWEYNFISANAKIFEIIVKIMFT